MSVADLVAGIMADPIGTQQAATAWAMQNASTVALWAGGIAGACAVGGLAAGAAVDGVRNRFSRRRERRESRKRLLRFMGGKPEARAAGLCRNPRLRYSAIVLGRLAGILSWVDQEPVLVTGGTRSGKGVGPITGTLLSWGGPLVSYDGGKGEAFEDTSWWRGLFSHVLNLDLANPAGVHWNPLDEIRPDRLTDDIDNLVEAIPKSAGGDGHFESAADSYIGAVICHVLLAEPDDWKNLAGVLRFVSRGDEGARRIILAKSHPFAVARATSLFGSSEEDVESDEGMRYRQSVYNSARVRLKVFDSDTIAAVTARSDFRLNDILVPGHDGRPVTLYLTTPASEDRRVRPLVSMFFSMLMSAAMYHTEKTSDGRRKEKRGLMLIDEFPSLRLALLDEAITKITGCKWTMFLGTQTVAALDAPPYGPNNNFRSNIRCSVHFSANDEATQRFVSRACGEHQEKRESTSRSTQPGRWGRGKAVSESVTRRPVLSEAEVREMRDDEEVILIRGQPAILAKKIQYFSNRVLSGRMYLPQSILARILRLKRRKRPPAPMRGADGMYPDLPHPARPSPWAGRSMVIAEPPPKRLSIGQGGGTPKPGGTILALSIPPSDDLPPAPDWAEGPTDTTKTAEALAKPSKPAAHRIPKLPPKVPK